MSLKDRVQVEPLDDDRWTRIERAAVASVRARGDARAPRSWRWVGAAGAMVAAAAAVMIAWGLAGRGKGKGEESVVIATDAKGTRVDLGDAVVAAAAETSFTVTRPGGGIELALARGRIELDVPSRRGKAPLVVHAGDVDVIDVGTVFSVTRGDAVTVEVSEGEVQVARAGKVARVAAGQRWSEPMIASAASAASAAATPGAKPATAGAGTIASTQSTAHDAVIPIGGPKDLLGRDHVAVAPPGGTVATSHNHGGNGNRSGSGNRNASGSATGTGSGSSAIMDLAAAIRAEAVEPAISVDAKTPADAFMIYRDRFSSSDEAHPSQMLYGMARAKFAAGENEDALHWLDAYLKRFTSGDETEAVLWLRVRILCTRGAIDDTCRAAAQTYLVHGTDPGRSKIAGLITDTIR